MKSPNVLPIICSAEKGRGCEKKNISFWKINASFQKVETFRFADYSYRLLLPEGTLDYFDLVDVKESVNEVVIYLEEKNIVPEKYTDQDIESKGFYDPVIVQDFPLRGKKVFLNM